MTPFRNALPRRPKVLLCGAALAIVVAVACRGARDPRGPADAPHPDRVGEFAVDRAAWDRYVRYETGLPPSSLDPPGAARLYEELLSEALLARAAERDRMTAPPAAVAAEVQRLASNPGVPAAAPVEQDARRRLLARLYEERVLAPAVRHAPAAEVEAAARAEDGPAGERVVFRQLRVATPADADRAGRRIASGDPFDQVARELSESPDRGRPLERSLTELPAAAADALRTAPEGGVTRPVALDGAYYVFQLDARASAGGAARARDREELERRLLRRAYDALRQQKLAELARSEGVRAPVPPRPAEDSTR